MLYYDLSRKAERTDLNVSLCRLAEDNVQFGERAPWRV